MFDVSCFTAKCGYLTGSLGLQGLFPDAVSSDMMHTFIFFLRCQEILAQYLEFGDSNVISDATKR